eukprot:6013437-Karenia_brevis.AAC.1
MMRIEQPNYTISNCNVLLGDGVSVQQKLSKSNIIIKCASGNCGGQKVFAHVPSKTPFEGPTLASEGPTLASEGPTLASKGPTRDLDDCRNEEMLTSHWASRVA